MALPLVVYLISGLGGVAIGLVVLLVPLVLKINTGKAGVLFALLLLGAGAYCLLHYFTGGAVGLAPAPTATPTPSPSVVK